MSLYRRNLYTAYWTIKLAVSQVADWSTRVL